MQVIPLTCALGAELTDVNLADAARDDALFDAVKAALLKHKVLFLRNQEFSRADHVAFARRFGELEDHPVAGSDPENPGLVRIYKSPDQPNDRYENSWHCDGTWRETPPMGSVLRCVECPPVGGDTMWANMALAYEKLPQHIKDLIAPLRARHSIECTFGAANVRVGQDFTQGSSGLLQYLISQAAIPEYQVRWRWEPNSVAIWDNRATQHYAVMDYPPCHRKMERAGIIGTPTF